jgi:hypothetical protein
MSQKLGRTVVLAGPASLVHIRYISPSALFAFIAYLHQVEGIQRVA